MTKKTKKTKKLPRWPNDNSDTPSDWEWEKLKKNFAAWILEALMTDGGKGMRLAMHGVMCVMQEWEEKRLSRGPAAVALRAETRDLKARMEEMRKDACWCDPEEEFTCPTCQMADLTNKTWRVP